MIPFARPASLPNTPGTRKRVERGSALIVCLLVTVALIGIGGAFLSVSLNDRTIASNNAGSARALHLAQAGLEDARATIPSTNVNTLIAGTGAFVLFTNKAFGGGTYSVTVANNLGPRFPDSIAAVDPGAPNDSDGILVLTATGQYGKTRRQVELMVLRALSDFQYAFWAQTKITISSSGYTDAYNSSVAPYVNPGTNDGDVFTNGTITLSGSSMVHGDLGVHGATGPSSGHVSGSTTLNAPAQTVSAVACPGTYPLAAAIPTGSGITYNAATGVLTVSGGGNNITLPVPPTSYYFSQVTLSGGSTMTLSGSQHVDIYISGKLTVSGGGIVNTAAKPTMLTIYGCGTGTQDFTISGSSDAYFAIHAPTRKVTISGTSGYYGAIVADEIDDSGGSAMHYDQALAGGSTPATAIPRSWREIFM